MNVVAMSMTTFLECSPLEAESIIFLIFETDGNSETMVGIANEDIPGCTENRTKP